MEYQGTEKELNRYLDEQKVAYGEIGKTRRKIGFPKFGMPNPEVAAAAVQFNAGTKVADSYYAFESMVQDYYDNRTLGWIKDSRDRDAMSDAIDERTDRVQEAMQNSNYVDTYAATVAQRENPERYYQAIAEGKANDTRVHNNADISVINSEKDVSLNQAEQNVISSLSGKDEYGRPKQLTAEELNDLKNRMQLIQELRVSADFGSHVQKPNSAQTPEQLAQNQQQLNQLQEHVQQEQQDIYTDLTTGRSR